ncbi:MAG: EamA family transporter [Solirubrobacteraceae bacterium]|nr:MAG: EamA family transporter [Solirubrobacterales bacterium]
MAAQSPRTLSAPARADQRSPRRGYLLAVAAATLWGVNGTLAKLVLDHGVSASRLAQLRATLTWAIALAVLAASARGRRLLLVAPSDIPRFAYLGIAGLALVSATYFAAIARLKIGVALTIQYLGPLLLLLWLRLVHRRQLARSLWGAAALSLAGCVLVLKAYAPGALDPVGVGYAFGAAISFALYLTESERSGHRYAPATTLLWGFGFATLFWALVEPPWTFPFHQLNGAQRLLPALGVAIVGTLLPFVCMLAALRHIPAPRAAVVATLEPVLAAIVAWLALGQSLAAIQVAGGLLVVGAVLWVQSKRPSLEAEGAAPARARGRLRKAAAARTGGR